MGMQRLNFFATDEQAERLRDYSSRTGRPFSDCLRHAIDLYPPLWPNVSGRIESFAAVALTASGEERMGGIR
jgi:hypothetical protein